MNKGEENFTVVVPQLYDTVAPIKHLGADVASKTLSSMTATLGNMEPALTCLRDIAQAWIDLAKNAKMSRCNLWFLMKRQFWPKVGFGAGMISASFNELSTCLHRQYYQLLSMGGIRR